MAAVLGATEACGRVRERLQPLLLKGQVKLHWTDESERRRREIVDVVSDLGTMMCIVSHLDARRRKVERYRRLCLEPLYTELGSMGVFDLTFESRSKGQDLEDRAHVVALQGTGLDRRIRITHERGGAEPLLWIADVVLGAVNAAHLGNPVHLQKLQSTILIQHRTQTSLAAGEKP